MTQLVKQRMKSDCGPCCLAMLTGKPLDEILTLIGDAFHPEQGLRHQHLALQKLGFDDKQQHFVCLYLPFPVTPKYFARYAWRRRALITVPSLNTAGGWHMVYYDGFQLFDPSQEKTYENFDQLQPEEIVLFDEHREAAA